MIVQRLLHPAARTRLLAEELSLEDTDEDDLYEAMDAGASGPHLAKRHLSERSRALPTMKVIPAP